MISREEQIKLDIELLIESRGYSERDNKPDGAYIKVKGIFFNLNKIKRLIEAGANVNVKNFDCTSPLHYAVEGYHIALAEYLISAGADVNAKNDVGESPLHWAVGRDNIALAEYLISAGADVNAKAYMGYSPLELAVIRGYKKIQDLLKQHGAI